MKIFNGNENQLASLDNLVADFERYFALKEISEIIFYLFCDHVAINAIFCAVLIGSIVSLKYFQNSSFAGSTFSMLHVSSVTFL